MRRPLRTRVVALVALASALAAGAVAAQSARPLDRRAIPGGRGWMCFEDPLPTGGATHTCDRPARACEQLRAQRRANGEATGGCVASPAAFCVSYTDHMEHRPARRHACNQTAAECAALRARLVASAAQMPVYTEISECGEVR